MANADYAVKAEQLTEGKIVVVRGTLGFAIHNRVIAGEELIRRNEGRRQAGKKPVPVPHTTATLIHAEVECADPARPTPEEVFVHERRYQSLKHPDTGLNWSIDSKGRVLPRIFVRNADGTYSPDLSGRELAQGLQVRLLMTVYKPEGYDNRGLRLDAILVDEEVKYYVPRIESELVSRGIVVAPLPHSVQPGATATPATATPTTGALQPPTDSRGLPLPQSSGLSTPQGAAWPQPAAGSAVAAAPEATASQGPAAGVGPLLPTPHSGGLSAPQGAAWPQPAPTMPPAVSTSPVNVQQQPQMSLEEQIALLREENARLQNEPPADAAGNGSAAGDGVQAGITFQPR